MGGARFKAAGEGAGAKGQGPAAGGDMPDDIDGLRRHHDDPHAPPGPHSLPGAAPPAPDVPMPPPDNLPDAPEAPADVEASPGPDRPPAAPPGSGVGPFTDRAAAPA